MFSWEGWTRKQWPENCWQPSRGQGGSPWCDEGETGPWYQYWPSGSAPASSLHLSVRGAGKFPSFCSQPLWIRLSTGLVTESILINKLIYGQSMCKQTFFLSDLTQMGNIYVTYLQTSHTFVKPSLFDDIFRQFLETCLKKISTNYWSSKVTATMVKWLNEMWCICKMEFPWSPHTEYFSSAQPRREDQGNPWAPPSSHPLWTKVPQLWHHRHFG